MIRAHMLAASKSLHLGSVTVPAWTLWVLALVVVLIIVSIIVVVLNRRARKITRATSDASPGAGDDGSEHGFGSYGAVTSAISITPDVKPRSRGRDNSKPDD